MANSITNGAMSNATDADFRAWVQEFHDLMVGPLGLLNTANTGQINTATVSKPAAANATQGFKIYKTNDGLVDLYLKVEFGSGGSATYPAIAITVATGTDGAGGMTGTVSTRYQASSAPMTGSQPRIANGKTGLWWVAFHKSASNAAQIGFMLGRTCDPAGNPTSEGWVLYASGNGAITAQSVRLLPTPQIQTAAANTYALIPYEITVGVMGDRPMVFGHQFALPEVRTLPYAVSYFASAISEGVPFTVPVLGVARTFIPLGTMTLSKAAGAGAPTGVYLALEW